MKDTIKLLITTRPTFTHRDMEEDILKNKQLPSRRERWRVRESLAVNSKIYMQDSMQMKTDKNSQKTTRRPVIVSTGAP